MLNVRERWYLEVEHFSNHLFIFLQTEKPKFEIKYFIIQVLNAKVENVNVRVMFWKVDQKQ